MTLYQHTSGLSAMSPAQVEQLTLDFCMEREAKRKALQKELNHLHAKADQARPESPAYLNCCRMISQTHRQLAAL